MSSDEISKLDQACQKVLGLPKIRFVGVINRMGRKIVGEFQRRSDVTSSRQGKSENVCSINARIHDEKRL